MTIKITKGDLHMLTLIFSILMIAVFGRLLMFAIRLAWGVLKVVLGLVFLPAAIILLFIKGLFVLAFPILIAVGIISLIAPRNNIA